MNNGHGGYDHPTHGRIRYSALDLVEILNSRRDPADAIDPPTAEQIAIIESPLEPSVVIAGAGSGKTTVISQRVLFLVANGLVPADAILGLTFTRKAVAELAAKIRDNLWEFRLAVGESGRDDELVGLDVPTVQTYNSYAAALVGEYGMALGIEEDTRVLDDASAIQLAGRVIDRASTAEVPVGAARAGLIAKVRALSAQMSEHLVDAAELEDYIYACYRRYFADVDVARAVARKRIPAEAKEAYAIRLDELMGAGLGPDPERSRLDALVGLLCDYGAADILEKLREKLLLTRLVERFRLAKRAAAGMEFSDQVAFACRIMDADPQAHAAERARWQVVLLDEYQDTSDTQVRLLKRLFGGLPVMAVGDPRQAIYGWRGASASNIDEFPVEFGLPGTRARVRSLSISWRNPSNVLAVANEVSSRIPNRGSGDELRAPDQPDAQGVPGPLATWKRGTVEHSLTTGAAVPGVGSDQMAQLLDWLTERTGSRAVLCRKSSHMFEVAAAATARGVPTHIVGRAGALEDPFVRDVFAALTVIADPTAGGEAMRLLTGTVCRLGPADIAALERLRRARADRLAQAYPDDEAAAALGVVEVIDELADPAGRGTLRSDIERSGLSDAALSRIGRLAVSLRRLRARRVPVPALIREIVHGLGIEAEARALGPERAAPHLVALDVFAASAANLLAAQPGTDLAGYLSWLELAAQTGGLDEPDEVLDKESGAVIIMTIHKSKGLEFDHVAIPHMVVGDLPTTLRTKTGWLQAEALPYPLRGDAASFPAMDLSAGASKDLKALRERFADALEDHHETEERRLAYVAVTRAQRSLWLGAATFSGRTRANELSPYVYDAATALDWDEPVLPGTDEEAPERAESYVWPTPQDRALLRVRSHKARVYRRAGEQKLGELARSAPHGDGHPDAPGHLAHIAADLLAQRANVLDPTRLPGRLSATAAVRYAQDPEAFAAELIRPMPTGPVPQAALGTAFHAWVENYFGQATLQDFEDPQSRKSLPAALQDRFTRLQRTFLASEFASRVPAAVELPFELILGEAGAQMRIPGKIDAVFPTETGFEVVDWKTGSSVTGTELRARAVQLAVYARAVEAMPRFAGRPVTATFFYLGDNRIVRPEELPDPDLLLERMTAGR
jgi:DNA helicase-2/ATP-dependent DNA helicase PcrA